MKSRLQKVQSKIAWIRGFRLQNVHAINLPRGVISPSTYQALHEMNYLIDKVRRLLKIDYEAYKARELAKRSEVKKATDRLASLSNN